MADEGLPFLRRQGESRQVLIVDDGSLVRLYYRGILEQAGFIVAEAINGVEAMEKVLSARFDLLVVDINMPQMDGLAFLRTLRATPVVASLPVLIASTEAGPQDRAAARAAGANHYLTKPVADTDLLLHAALLTGAPA
ncbi:response regulator [Niveispirillum sp.]|uniref:response regulator n=1 Tax=Niveispirillum sp. TaxID=1917217 RepID=UPI001B60B2CB|nr:response regulator [Niveispirillum sp.]MBP7339297.1 response regulator [Niveispirillum sp.]